MTPLHGRRRWGVGSAATGDPYPDAGGGEPAASTVGVARLRLGDGEGAAAVLPAVERRDRRTGLVVRPHPHETEPDAAPRIPVADDLRALDRPEGREQLPEVRARGRVTEIPDVQLGAHGGAPSGVRDARH